MAPTAALSDLTSRQELRNIVLLPFSEQEKGWLFEKWLTRELQSRGMDDAEWMGAASKTPYDVVSASFGFRIQCKYTQTKKGSVDVRPSRPVAGSLIRRYRKSDFDVLAVYRASRDELYFVASCDFQCNEFSGMVRGHFRFGAMQEHSDSWSVLFPSRAASQDRERQKRLNI